MANAHKKNEIPSFQSGEISSCEDLRHLLTQLCEEVCFLRVTKKESEERVRHLVADQHKHERQLEEEILKNSSLKEKHVQKLADLDRSYQDEIQHLKREKNKLIWENESWERNVKSVKDEVRTLQLEKYNLERMIREQSHCLKTHATASSSHMKQATEIETAFMEIKQLVERCNTQSSNFSKEVKEAIALNKQLNFINSHHNCEKRDLETKLEDKEKIICELEITSKIRRADADDDDDVNSRLEQKQELAVVQEQLRAMKNNEEILQKQLDQSRERNKEIIAQYEEAQKLVEQYMTGNERHKSNASELELENTKLREEVESLHEAMKEGRNRETDLKQQIDRLNASLNSKENYFRTEISGLKDETEYLLKTSGILRDKNGSLEKKHNDALAQVTKLQEELNKRQTSKVDVSTLTEEKHTEEDNASKVWANSQPIVHANNSSLSVKNKAVLGEPGSSKHKQQMSVEDCVISASSPNLNMNVSNMTIHSEKVQQEIVSFEKTPKNSNEGIDDGKNTLDTFIKAGSLSLYNTHNNADAAKLKIPDDDVSSSKGSSNSVLLVHTTENISSKFEEMKRDTCDAGFKNMPTGVIVTENLATKTPDVDNVITSGIEVAYTNVIGNTGSITTVTEEQNTTCENNPEALSVLVKNAAEAVTTGLSSADDILRISEQVNDAEKETNVATLESKDKKTSDEVGINKMESHVIDGSQDTGVIKASDKQDMCQSPRGLEYANVTHKQHEDFSDVKTVITASEDVNSSHIDQTKVHKITFRLSTPATYDEGTRESKASSFEDVKAQEQINIIATVKENSIDPNIASDSGNAGHRASECSTSVLASTSVNNDVTNSQNTTHERCSYETTKLSQHCGTSNHVVDTTISESIPVGSTSQMVTVSEGIKYNDFSLAVPFKSDFPAEFSKSSALPLDTQMSERKKRQPNFIEDSRPPSPKRRCIEYKTSKADEVNLVSVGPHDHDHPIPATRSKPLSITSQQDVENTPSFTAVTRITDVQDKVASTEILPSQEKVQGTPKYENLPQMLRVNTPDKPSASFDCLNPGVPTDSLLTQCSASSNGTRAPTIKPVLTTLFQQQYTPGKSQEETVCSLNMLPFRQPLPPSRLLLSERLISPTSGVVELQNPVMKTNLRGRLEISCRGSEFSNQYDVTSKEAMGLCDMSRSAGRHTIQPSPSNFSVSTSEICAVSWSGYHGKGGLTPPTRVSPRSSTGCEFRFHGVSKDFLSPSKFKVKLHDVLKDFPSTAGQTVQVLQGKCRLAGDKRDKIVGKTIDDQPLPLEHNCPAASSSSEVDIASRCDNESDICTENLAVQPMSPDTVENSNITLPKNEQDTSKKRHVSSQDSQINLFSDDDEEEDDISSTLTKEIERAQSILNRNRLKRTRRCKQMND